MLNKRVKMLLTLALAGAMVLSEPAASWASGEETGKSSQSESKKSDDEDSEKADKAEGKKEEKAGSKKKKVSSNGTSSNTASSNKVSATPALNKGKTQEKDSDDPENQKEKKSATETPVLEKETENVLPAGKAQSWEEDDKIEELDAREERAHAFQNTFNITGGAEGTDYSYDSSTGVLTVSTNKELTVSGTVSEGSMVVNSPEGANLHLNGLDMTTSANSALNIVSGTGKTQIYLEGNSNNILNGAGSGIQVDSGSNVNIDGTGILSGTGVTGNRTVTISGGNILADVKNLEDDKLIKKEPEDESTGAPADLSANTLYSVSGNTAAYKNGVYSSQDGKVALYIQEGYQAVVSGDTLYVVSVNATPSPSVTPSPSPSPSVTPSPSPSVTMSPKPTVVPDLASETGNGLYWIDSGKTYRSGATLQFYATGDGYGPEEPQELNPVIGSTRYIPVNWNVSTTSTYVSGSNGSARGTWNKYTKETQGSTSGGAYVPGEYRYEASFLLSTTGTTSVPFTLQVNYQKQAYDGSKWRDDGGTVSKSVGFYILNTTATVTPTPRPSTTYVQSTVTTSAAGSSVSSNAKNATTGDETPIGTLVVLLVAAVISGAAVFRKKRIH